MAEETKNQVVKSEPTKLSIKDEFNNPNSGWAKELGKILPSPKEVGTFMACAWAQFADAKNGRKLLACTRNSIFSCIQKSARAGIRPDGVNGYLIPYGSECTLQFSYRGLCDMAIREGIAKKFTADIVRANDIFRWSNGELVEHTPVGWTEEERGDIVGCWVRATLPDGDHQDVRLSKSDIEQIRSKSLNKNGVWREWYEEMAKKSAVKRLFKMMRNTPQLQAAIDADNENYDLEQKSNAPRKANNSVDFGEDDEPSNENGDAIEAEAEVVS